MLHNHREQGKARRLGPWSHENSFRDAELGHQTPAQHMALRPQSDSGQVASNTSAAKYEVLVPDPDKLPKKDATKEPTYRLRKAMKLV